uniref:Uncharacterized protein n=1 Tax=Oryza sativa subsp. japonica TaxID=39947 RepID=Q6K3Q5_ORYSJ|nr:hypothetical protein [Oryza sativa Japonica Group]
MGGTRNPVVLRHSQCTHETFGLGRRNQIFGATSSIRGAKRRPHSQTIPHVPSQCLQVWSKLVLRATKEGRERREERRGMCGCPRAPHRRACRLVAPSSSEKVAGSMEKATEKDKPWFC